MNTIKVKVEVAFDSGATINITPEQNTKVVNFVSDMLFKNIPAVKPVATVRTKKRRQYIMWKPEETALIVEASKLKGKEYNKAVRQIAHMTRRSIGSIYAKVCDVKGNRAVHKVDVPKSWF